MRNRKRNNKKLGIAFLIIIGIYVIYEIIRAIIKGIAALLQNKIFITAIIILIIVAAVAAVSFFIYRYFKNANKTTYSSAYGSSKTRTRKTYRNRVTKK